MNTRIIRNIFSALIVMSLTAGFALAEYPDRPIKVIVPFGAGGETDLSARILASELQEKLGQNVIVQNITGAAGMTGTKAVLAAEPDGYTLGVIPSAPLSMHAYMRELPYSYKDFDYVCRIFHAPFLLYVHKDSPWNTVADFVEAQKKDPGKYFWGSSGVGSVPYIAGMALLQELDIEAKHVPFSDGDSGAFQAMAGKRIQWYITAPAALSKFDVKALAVLDSKRDNMLPDLPTISESGHDIFFSQWVLLYGTKGIPKEILAKLGIAAKEISESKSFKEKMARLGLVPGYLNSEDTMKMVEEANKRNEVIIKKVMSKVE